jgi:hypothetical protein
MRMAVRLALLLLALSGSSFSESEGGMLIDLVHAPVSQREEPSWPIFGEASSAARPISPFELKLVLPGGHTWQRDGGLLYEVVIRNVSSEPFPAPLETNWEKVVKGDEARQPKELLTFLVCLERPATELPSCAPALFGRTDRPRTLHYLQSGEKLTIRALARFESYQRVTAGAAKVVATVSLVSGYDQLRWKYETATPPMEVEVVGGKRSTP